MKAEKSWKSLDDNHQLDKKTAFSEDFVTGLIEIFFEDEDY